jgi:ABC-2 type transport system permease protein
VRRSTEHATLDLLLANPISRRRVALEKAGAMFLTLSLLSLVTFAALAVATAAAGMDVTLGHLAAAAFAVELLALLYGALALMVGAASGRSGLALAVAGAAAVAAYLANVLGSLVPALAPLRQASPLYQYAAVDPLRHGLTFEHAAPLAITAALLVAAAVVAFTRRGLH